MPKPKLYDHVKKRLDAGEQLNYLELSDDEREAVDAHLAETRAKYAHPSDPKHMPTPPPPPPEVEPEPAPEPAGPPPPPTS
jgi:hypothetical protein